ncbi:hypothetical protein [Brochothrix thermosphacta]|uniref:hypothetical protein n=1 Tax=Brochothrix thermosphacta TaxID=2756 RepID=UPI00083F9ACC|nr:hypothetical protein [Brochothrix thermosphacta]ODJ72014.1 hypothetical protein BFR39_04560 [Brochothrix thermosphacta]
MNYFEVYLLILRTVYDKKPKDFQTLLDFVADDESVYNLRSSIGDEGTLDTLQEITGNLINDNLVDGSIIRHKDGNLFDISGLSTQGYIYLEQLKSPKFKEKLILFAKEEGIPLTYASVTKLIARIIWS